MILTLLIVMIWVKKNVNNIFSYKLILIKSQKIIKHEVKPTIFFPEILTNKRKCIKKSI